MGRSDVGAGGGGCDVIQDGRHLTFYPELESNKNRRKLEILMMNIIGGPYRETLCPWS